MPYEAVSVVCLLRKLQRALLRKFWPIWKSIKSVYAAALKKDAEPYQDQDLKKATAIVVGTEAIGLSEDWLENANKKIIIPMNGKIDSMNVSVAAAVLIFEAKRQRNFS